MSGIIQVADSARIELILSGSQMTTHVDGGNMPVYRKMLGLAVQQLADEPGQQPAIDPNKIRVTEKK
jgi:hypothetical protein